VAAGPSAGCARLAQDISSTTDACVRHTCSAQEIDCRCGTACILCAHDVKPPMHEICGGCAITVRPRSIHVEKRSTLLSVSCYSCHDFLTTRDM
jgi:hypothetical protein